MTVQRRRPASRSQSSTSSGAPLRGGQPHDRGAQERRGSRLGRGARESAARPGALRRARRLAERSSRNQSINRERVIRSGRWLSCEGRASLTPLRGPRFAFKAATRSGNRTHETHDERAVRGRLVPRAVEKLALLVKSASARRPLRVSHMTPAACPDRPTSASVDTRYVSSWLLARLRGGARCGTSRSRRSARRRSWT